MAIRNPQALFSGLVQQHTKYAQATMDANGWTVGYVRTMSDDEAREVCEAVQAAVTKRWGHAAWTCQAICKSLIEAYGTADAAYEAREDKVNVWKGLTFEYNGTNGGRKGNRKPLDVQQAEFREALRRAKRFIDGQDEDGTPVEVEDVKVPEIPVEVEVKAPATRANNGPDAFDQLDTILAKLREFCSGRGIEGNFVQSARADFNGYRMVAQGIPPLAIAASIATTWSADTRSQCTASTGIKLDYDPATFGERIDGLHRVTPYLIATIKANVPVYMHGATGTLKSSGLKRAAEEMGLTYYEVNLAGQLASAITGRDLLKKFMESAYIKAYRDGGIIALEEIDKAHPLVLTQINNSIESDEYFNPLMEEPIKRHKDFRIACSGNTPGTGPTKEFNASNKLDDSTLDRFREGYIKVNRDHVVVRSILDKMKAELTAA